MTEENEKPTVIQHQENHNCQIFQGPVNGAVFAMPGATVNYNPTIEVRPQGEMASSNASSREERVAKAIKQMVDEDMIIEKQQFAAIFQILHEKGIYENLTQQAFVDFLKNHCQLPTDLVPDRSLLGKVAFAGRFPEWQTSKSDPSKNAQMVRVARQFLDYSGY